MLLKKHKCNANEVNSLKIIKLIDNQRLKIKVSPSSDIEGESNTISIALILLLLAAELIWIPLFFIIPEIV